MTADLALGESHSSDRVECSNSLDASQLRSVQAVAEMILFKSSVERVRWAMGAPLHFG